MFRILLAAVAIVALALTAGRAGLARRTQAGSPINPADFNTTITNPYYPLSSIKQQIYTGSETDGSETLRTRDEVSVLPQTATIAGVTVVVVKDQVFVDGELTESTLDYFAQHRDGSVYYFGEDVDNYEGGVVINHEGSWRAGDGENLPGVFMPPNPAAGQTFEQERAPGVGEDRTTVLETGLTVTVPAGTFQSCIKTEDLDPLADATENKWYCAGVGFVREEAEDEELELASQTLAAPSPAPTAAALAPTQSPAAPIVAPATGTGDGGGKMHAWWWIAAAVSGGAVAAGAGVMRRRVR